MNTEIETTSITADRAYSDAFEALMEASGRLNATAPQNAADDHPVMIANQRAFRAAQDLLAAVIDNHTAQAVAAAVNRVA